MSLAANSDVLWRGIPGRDGTDSERDLKMQPGGWTKWEGGTHPTGRVRVWLVGGQENTRDSADFDWSFNTPRRWGDIEWYMHVDREVVEFKEGDKVKVVRKVIPPEWTDRWTTPMDGFVLDGFEYTVLKVVGDRVRLSPKGSDTTGLGCKYFFPPEALELVSRGDEISYPEGVYANPKGQLEVCPKNDPGAHYRRFIPVTVLGQELKIQLDPAKIARVYEIGNPMQFTILKKVLKLGERGYKSKKQDLLDIIGAAQRELELMSEDQKEDL